MIRGNSFERTRLDLICDLFIVKQHETLTLNFDIVLLLVALPGCDSRASPSNIIVSGVLLLLALLVLLFLFSSPDLIDLERREAKGTGSKESDVVSSAQDQHSYAIPQA